MRITEALLGEHGAMYPLLDLLERSTPYTDLDGIKAGVACLSSVLSSHARIEEELLRPAILAWLPAPVFRADEAVTPSDHEVIEWGLALVLASTEVEKARRLLLDTLSKTRVHFQKEETIIFGIAERELAREVQEQLGAEWARRRGVSLN